MSFDRHVHRTIFGSLTKFAWLLLSLCVGILFFGGILYVVLGGTPHAGGLADSALENDVDQKIIVIPSGVSLDSIAGILGDSDVIMSPIAFRMLAKVKGVENTLKAGTYYIGSHEGISDILNRLSIADYRIPTKKITLFEGEAVFQYAERIDSLLKNVNAAELIRLSKGKEGFLFPDTYSVPVNADTKEFIDILEKNYKTRTSVVRTQIEGSQYTEQQIITMASLVESEAGSASYATKQRVAGVLWKRIQIGMPLQADAVFSFIYQKHLPQVLFSHLEVDSPYNVYKNTGLPPGPISNPGIDSIRATLNPNIKDDLFYITGKDGVFYYARTLAGHNTNIVNHLR